MDRRKFLAATGSALGATSLAGCGLLGSSELPPPRKSDVFEPIEVAPNALVVPLESDPEAEAAATDGNNAVAADAVGSLAPVGVARAAKGRGAAGRGSRGSYAGAPHGAHGRAIWHGEDDDDDWRDNHQSQLEMYQVAIPAVAFARVGGPTDDEDNLPGAGPPGNWDARMESVDAGEQVRWERDLREGWYRVGANLQAENADRDLGWSAVDLNVVESGGQYEIDEKWKVEPRLNTSD
ncbi:hypothetical protein [Halorientalis regularis]|uniref:Uncharacterized protein n=1 Tax=Halorientalis regularis TaxID=660518 RepID=A0A1G7HVP7_9EURY|nr:hypothetical protein [Halorientalis regularis]SDF04591.1 hypothetical protein SAMN05216218_103180 [Halorientalis regularis]